MKPIFSSAGALASLLLAACGGVAVQNAEPTGQPGTGGSPATAGSSSTGAAGSSSTGAAGSSTSTGTASSSGSGAMPGCASQIAAPTDCGDFAAECGGARPIAGGGIRTFASGVAVDATYVYWHADQDFLGNCGGAIYRTPKSGGPATLFTTTGAVHAFEADDATLYITEGYDAIRAVDSADGSSVFLGAVDGGDASTAYGFAKTPGGMVLFGDNGPWEPSFYSVTATGFTPIAAHVGPSGYLGSAPAFDGASLFFAWSPASSSDPWPLMRTEVGSSAVTPLVPSDLTTRMYASVAVSGDDLFFITGDPSVDFGMVPRPMGISRVSKSGGAVTTLVPPGPVFIDRILVDATDLYFTSAPLVGATSAHSIQTIPRAGGPLRTVWAGAAHPDALHLDGGSLYFSIEARKPNAEFPGPGGLIVTVPTGAAAPPQ